MNQTESELLTRAVQAETAAEFLYEALHRIVTIAPYDKVYDIAETACDAYQKTVKKKETK